MPKLGRRVSVNCRLLLCLRVWTLWLIRLTWHVWRFGRCSQTRSHLHHWLWVTGEKKGKEVLCWLNTGRSIVVCMCVPETRRKSDCLGIWVIRSSWYGLRINAYIVLPEEKNPWCIRLKCFELSFVALPVLHNKKAVYVKYFLADPSVDLLYNNGQYLVPRLG